MYLGYILNVEEDVRWEVRSHMSGSISLGTTWMSDKHTSN